LLAPDVEPPADCGRLSMGSFVLVVICKQDLISFNDTDSDSVADIAGNVPAYG
jgi:hypothetical protein